MENNCAFCDRSKFEERIISETDDLYVIATLGQITDGGYVLVFPKRHVSCLGAMEELELASLSTFLHTKIRPAFEKEYPQITRMMFEHGIVGQTIKHAHLHIVPGEFHLSSRINKDFPAELFKRTLLFMYTEKTSPLTDLGRLYKKRQEPYLLWKDKSTMFYNPMVCWNPPAPPQYLRTITAEALGRPERGNWRDMDPELDKNLWTETVQRLRHYFK